MDKPTTNEDCTKENLCYRLGLQLIPEEQCTASVLVIYISAERTDLSHSSQSLIIHIKKTQ